MRPSPTGRISASSRVGSYGTYRKAHSTDIQPKGRVPHDVTHPSPFDIDLLCR